MFYFENIVVIYLRGFTENIFKNSTHEITETNEVLYVCFPAKGRKSAVSKSSH